MLPGSWNSWTLGEYADATAKAAAGLQDAGLGPAQRILLMMRNRPDFHWFDLAAQFLRATPVSIYNSSSPEEIQYLAGHAGAEIAIVEDAGYLDKLLEIRDQLPALKQIYVIDPPAEGCPPGVQPASVLMDHGSADLDALAAEVQPDDIATLIYTSGTTGPPKGVMISQYNVVYTVESLRICFGIDDFVGKRVVSYLPMAHIAERMMSHYQALILGYSVYCCPDANRLSAYLKEVRPEVVFGVPRVWEKIYNGINAALAANPENKAKFDEGVTHGSRHPGRPTRRHGHQGTTRHSRLPRRRGVCKRSSARRARRRRRHGDRCCGNPPSDPGVVQRDRCTAQRDLRHERIERPDDVEPAGQPPRLRRPGNSGMRRGDRRRRRSDLQGRQRVPGLLRTARQDGRDHRRRLAVLGRHR